MCNDKSVIFEFVYPETVRGLYSEVKYKTSYSLYRKGYETIAQTIKTLFDKTRCGLSVRIGENPVADLIAIDGTFELFVYTDAKHLYKISLPEDYPVTEYEIMPINLARWIALQIFTYARHNFR